MIEYGLKTDTSRFPANNCSQLRLLSDFYTPWSLCYCFGGSFEPQRTQQLG